MNASIQTINVPMEDATTLLDLGSVNVLRRMPWLKLITTHISVKVSSLG